MKQYRITGMSCAACQARVEKAVNAVDGVTACSVSLLTNSMGVEGSAAPEEIIAAGQAAGYGAGLKEKKPTAPAPDEELPDDFLENLESAGEMLVDFVGNLIENRLFGEDEEKSAEEHVVHLPTKGLEDITLIN